MKSLSLVFSLVAFVFATTGCDNKTNKIPSDVKYEIVSETFQKTYKKSIIKVTLNKKVTKEVLAIIAEEVKLEYPSAKNYMISYYLPDMESDRAWAITNFNPDPDISILGSTEAEYNKMKAGSNPNGDIIGRWKDETPCLERTIIIYKQKDSLKLRSIYKDGSFGDYALMADKLNKSKFLKTSYKNECYIIESDGNLGTYNNGKMFSKSLKE